MSYSEINISKRKIDIILKVDSRWYEQLDEFELNGEKCTNRI